MILRDRNMQSKNAMYAQDELHVANCVGEAERFVRLSFYFAVSFSFAVHAIQGVSAFYLYDII